MRVFMRILLAVVLIGGIAALGYGVWTAGYQQGLVETTEAATEVVVAPYYPGFYGFGVFGLIFKAFFVFLLFGLVLKFFFGWRYWRGHAVEGGHDQYRSRMDEKLSRWHDEAHGRTPPERTDPSE